jgi:peptidoglycan/LPS O-acetylase OafA/YrhL
MTHFIVFIVAKKLVGWQRFVNGSVVERLGVLMAWGVLVVGATVCSFYLVEEPGRRLVRRWAARI